MQIQTVTAVFHTLLAAVMLLAHDGTAQVKREITESALKAMGAPNNPRVEVAWNRYYDTGQIQEIMRRIASAHPTLARVSTIGKSVEGKDLLLITITDFDRESPDQKPAMYIDGNIHSNEIQGAEVALYTAWFLCESHGSLQWIRELLRDKTLYIVPTINPDARDYFIHKPNNAHSPRSGMDPRDDDGDGLVDEDGPDDLDGDGNIVQLRKRDPRGRFVADPDDPRLLVRAKPDQPGQFVMLGWEGIDNDGDHQVNEDGPGYYDPNRDWAWNWAPRSTQDGADRFPFSIPENRAAADFVIAHPNIAAAQSYHNNGGMILRGPGAAEGEKHYHVQDVQVFDAIGKTGEEILPGYRYMVTYKDLYTVFGGELDWFYGARGILTFTNELWTNFDYFRRESRGEGDRGEGRRLPYRFDRLLLFEEGVVPWRAFRHPQYGDVELGGFKKAWIRTAPSFMIEDMCHRNMAFSLYHLYHTPKVSVDSIRVRKLEGGLTEVTAVVANTRMIPTHTAHDIRNKITRPDWITLEGGKVLAGVILEDRHMEFGREQKRNPRRIELENIPGMGAAAVRWVVEGDGPFTVTVDSQKGGAASRTLR